MKKVVNWVNVLALSAILVCESASHGSTMETHRISLTGSASGGVLILLQAPVKTTRYVSIKTMHGESAESVVRRLASAINEQDPFGWYGPKVWSSQDISMHATGNSLGTFPGPLGGYIFAGTEKGLGIPRPPLSLSCSYHPEKDQIILHWVNPPEGYDEVRFIKSPLGLASSGRPGTLTSYVLDRKGRDINDMSFCVIGFRGGVPSNAAAIHLSYNAQDELISLPFTDGVAPNWTCWSKGPGPHAAKFEQGTKHAVSEKKRNIIRRPRDKPFFQFLKASAPDVKMGVSRKFLGLTTGHTYRISARLNTLEMDSSQADWSFSLHAAHNGHDGTDLTVDQLSGLAPLPDGSAGPAAGRIASYGPGVTTNGNWVKRSTNDDPGPGLEITDIVLPASVDSITVWVRHSGSDPMGVGIDWVKIEDLSVVEP